jgi:2-acetylphloroglucinol acetyltransferase
LKSGIVGYGASIPYRRMDVQQVLNVWKNSDYGLLKYRLRAAERAVLFFNEDTNTLATESSRNALKQAGLDGKEIGALYLGTGTNPWASNPSSTLIAESIGTTPDVICADVQFSGKSGTSAIQVCSGLTESDTVKYGMAIGADTLNRHVEPGQLFEYVASAGSVSFVIGKEKVIASIQGAQSYTSSLCDWFRIEGERYIKTGSSDIPDAIQIGLQEHIVAAVQKLNKKLNLKPGDYTYAVFQQPYGYVPFMLASALDFKPEQVGPGAVSEQIGDCGAASSLLGLANVLDFARPGDRILLASYGFGAGSDAFSFEVTSEIEAKRGRAPLVKDLLSRKEMVDYATAMKYELKYLRSIYPLGPMT